MKTWLAKFKISNALNDRRPLSVNTEAASAKSATLRQFTQQTAALDQLLKNPPLPPTVSAPQHSAIMRAVRTAQPVSKFFWPKALIPATAIMVIILITATASLHFRHQNSTAADSSLAFATAALQTRDTLAQTFPAATQPLADELASLNRDATNAQNFILASLP